MSIERRCVSQKIGIQRNFCSTATYLEKLREIDLLIVTENALSKASVGKFMSFDNDRLLQYVFAT